MGEPLLPETLHVKVAWHYFLSLQLLANGKPCFFFSKGTAAKPLKKKKKKKKKDRKKEKGNYIQKVQWPRYQKKKKIDENQKGKQLSKK